MTATLSNLINRDDTFLGVCQAIGDDFGFNADWLRIALAVPVIFNPMLSFAAYGALAVVVVISRLLVPAAPRGKAELSNEALPIAVGIIDAANDAVPLPLAA